MANQSGEFLKFCRLIAAAIRCKIAQDSRFWAHLKSFRPENHKG